MIMAEIVVAMEIVILIRLNSVGKDVNMKQTGSKKAKAIRLDMRREKTIRRALL